MGDLNKQKFDNVLVGTELFDDAGVVKISDDLALVTTVDFFTPVVDDPFDFGAIAAANSLSDIYAMGAVPISAINVVGFPEGKVPMIYLEKIMAGGLSITQEAGIPIVGGHTIKAPEPFYGLSITGTIHPDKVLSNSLAKAGDLLYLTKPLGTGLITTAAKNGKTTDEVVQNAIAIMKELNKSGADAIKAVCSENKIGGCGVTDITGYGLLGHLGEMLEGSKKSAILNFSKVKLIDGALELAKQNTFPSGSRANWVAIDNQMNWDGDFEEYEKLILSDAQTSGGLLIAMKPEFSEILESEMIKRNINFAQIGEIVEKEEWLIKVKRK